MMGKIADDNLFFMVGFETEYFKIDNISIPDGGGTARIHRKGISKVDAYNLWENPEICESDQRLQVFYLSYLIISVGEIVHRDFILRISDRKTRNIPLKVLRSSEYLEQTIKDVRITEEKTNQYNKGGRTAKVSYKKMKNEIDEEVEKNYPLEKLDDIIKQALMPVMVDLGFPEINPAEYSFKITDAVIAAAKTESCIQYLNQLKPRGVIFPHEFVKICQVLNDGYAADAAQVIFAIEKTKSREHIAALSISTEDNQTYVSIANVNRHHIKMEDWKFLALIGRSGEALRLHEYEEKKYGGFKKPFTYNNNKSGIVTAKFTPEKAIIDIACVDGANIKNIHDCSTFVVDLPYTLCFYSILSRLRDDKERFDRLYEQASIVAIKDPFDLIYQPLI